MKKSLILSALACGLAIVLFSGCNFSVGTKKDFNTGLKVSYNGFKIDNAYLVNSAGKPLNTNKISLDSGFAIQVTGVENYTLKNGKAYPGCELQIWDKTGKSLGTAPDLMAELTKNGLEPNAATTLSATLTLHEPFKRGETYRIAARFFDKENKKNEIKTDVEVVLK
jgi:hypothetical protein